MISNLQIKYLIQRMENQEREKKKVANQKLVLQEQKKKNRELMKDGKAPVFVSKQEQKNNDLVKKYEELKQTNRLETYMKKKNKKNLSKERKQFKTNDLVSWANTESISLRSIRTTSVIKILNIGNSPASKIKTE